MQRETRNGNLQRGFILTAARVFLANAYCDDINSYFHRKGSRSTWAVLAAYSENNLDIVYWDTFSLATKQPSLIAKDNLKNFYIQFAIRSPEMVLSDSEIANASNAEGYRRTLQQAAFAVGFALCLRAIQSITEGLEDNVAQMFITPA
ncbi:4265_t:CDS:2 [Paraglomus occultum]|uniref:4265_t:CDS:1 n=1 Tax=Paraglomus occultum TaxID=144539 RepID=A0A9N9FAW1_9GLOM|nr:4265_t:CDS:2 [Paraglomus occultum]